MFPDEIIRERNAGEIRCGFTSCRYPDERTVASKFGLNNRDCLLKEVARNVAEKIVEALLWKDMAYQCELLSQDKARELAHRFMEAFPWDAHFFTNGNWHEYPDMDGWNPWTSATFDGGVLAVSERLSGCLWVEDEDCVPANGKSKQLTLAHSARAA